MPEFDFVIYKNKKFSDILEEIHKKSKDKDKKINILIDELKPLIKTMSDASLLVPLLKEYLEIGVKNDDNLIKLAAIIQRTISKESTESANSFGLSEEDIQKIEDEMKTNIDSKIKKIGDDVNKIKGVMNEEPVSEDTEEK